MALGISSSSSLLSVAAFHLSSNLNSSIQFNLFLYTSLLHLLLLHQAPQSLLSVFSESSSSCFCRFSSRKISALRIYTPVEIEIPVKGFQRIHHPPIFRLQERQERTYKDSDACISEYRGRGCHQQRRWPTDVALKSKQNAQNSQPSKNNAKKEQDKHHEQQTVYHPYLPPHRILKSILKPNTNLSLPHPQFEIERISMNSSTVWLAQAGVMPPVALNPSCPVPA